MNQRIDALIAGCGIMASALMPIEAFAADYNAKPLRIVDAAGHVVGNLYGKGNSDFVVFRYGDALVSLRVEGPHGDIRPVEATGGGGLWFGAPNCAGNPILQGMTVSVTGTIPVTGFKDTNGRYIAYLPKTTTIGSFPIYSQRAPEGNCQPLQPVPRLGYPAEAVPLDTYFVAPFRLE